jgi:3'-phosphoadenosine 5'-phosphosulfate sulfotransferase (PAPS reductase)/FAD synthetase
MVKVGTIFKNRKLEEKEESAKKIILKALSRAKNPYILFTGKIDSLVMLHLIQQLQDGKLSFPVLHIDTTVYFPEVYQFIDKMRKLWGFALLSERNEEALRTISIAEDKKLCCRLLKTETLRKTIDKYKIDYLFFSRSWDEAKEDPLLISKENCELINPLHHFSESDTWNYIKKSNLSYCSLYDRGVQKIDCIPCTKIVKKARSNKRKDKIILRKLEELGYM